MVNESVVNTAYNIIKLQIFIFPWHINQILTLRQEKFIAIKTNNIKVGFDLLKGTTPLQWLNNSIDTFKVKCKKLLLD